MSNETPAAQTDAEHLQAMAERLAKGLGIPWEDQEWSSPLSPADIAWLLKKCERQRKLLDKCVGLLTPLAYYLDSLPAGRANAVEIRSLLEEVRRG